jgi:hypothetical protein
VDDRRQPLVLARAEVVHDVRADLVSIDVSLVEHVGRLPVDQVEALTASSSIGRLRCRSVQPAQPSRSSGERRGGEGRRRGCRWSS